MLGALGAVAAGIGTSFIARPAYSAGRNVEVGVGFAIPGVVGMGLAIPMIATKPSSIPVSIYKVVDEDAIQPLVDATNAQLGDALGVSERRRLEIDAEPLSR